MPGIAADLLIGPEPTETHPLLDQQGRERAAAAADPVAGSAS